MTSTKTARWLIFVLASVLPFLGGATSGAVIGVTRCGGIIPIDSQYTFDPVWSLSPFHSRVSKLSGDSLAFEKRHASVQLRQEVTMLSGVNFNSATVFEIVPGGISDAGASQASSEDKLCSVSLDPLAGAMSGVVSRSARLTFLDVDRPTNGACSSALNVSLRPRRGDVMTFYFPRGGFAASQSVGFATTPGDTWPMTVTFNSDCAVQFLLLLDRYGAIGRWYVWIPTTVYTGAVVALLLPVVLFRPRLPVHLAGVCLFLVFLGFLGSCIALVLELFQWQSAVGRMFPFPDSVTLYCCLCVLYALLLVPVLHRQGDNVVLFMGATRLFVFGLNCALCVGYWTMGYVVLGSLAAFQFLVTNVVITYYYAYVSVHLRRSMKGTSSLPHFSHNFAYLWCAPITPFACCALMYYDLYLLGRRGVGQGVEVTRVRAVIRVYNAQMSLPLLFLQNVYGVALLATVCAYHMPLVVLLFAALLFCIVHAIYVVGQYTREWSRWRRRGGCLGLCGSISLSEVMAQLLFMDHDEGESRQIPHGSSQAASLSPHTAQRLQEPGQYERDVAAYQAEDSASSSSLESDVFFPPPPPRRIAGESDERPLSQRPPGQFAVFTTPPRQSTSSAPEFWPSSVER
ncbi:hypothetical protein NESM_000828200 [Novymonas esmeraldas]|uniref:Uncharacterized protein n=1 Tax=Novymonas esmeraldas TaxID=1808958 RepID=A0AAW0EYM9_9TRYP